MALFPIGTYNKRREILVREVGRFKSSHPDHSPVKPPSMVSCKNAKHGYPTDKLKEDLSSTRRTNLTGSRKGARSGM